MKWYGKLYIGILLVVLYLPIFFLMFYSFNSAGNMVHFEHFTHGVLWWRRGRRYTSCTWPVHSVLWAGAPGQVIMYERSHISWEKLPCGLEELAFAETLYLVCGSFSIRLAIGVTEFVGEL